MRVDRLVRGIRPVSTVLGLGSFLAILGPYGTAVLGWPGVWLYWTGLIALGWTAGGFVGPLAARRAPDWPLWTHYVAAGTAVTVIVTLAVAALNGWLEGGPGWRELPVTFALVAVISAFVTALAWLLDARQTPRTAIAPATLRADETLLSKLPPALRSAEIHALQAEDHYLRVRTCRGEALILMRLSDALAACRDLEGTQTHRSWWVARKAVMSADKRDGRAVLTLIDGARAPVSRTYYPALRDGGWF